MRQGGQIWAFYGRMANLANVGMPEKSCSTMNAIAIDTNGTSTRRLYNKIVVN
jgi:hypothetical protein